MANNSINMNKIRQIFRLHSLGISKLKIAEQTGVARNTIKKYIKEFTVSKLSFLEINILCDKDLEDLFNPIMQRVYAKTGGASNEMPMPEGMPGMPGNMSGGMPGNMGDMLKNMDPSKLQEMAKQAGIDPSRLNEAMKGGKNNEVNEVD